jgi:hypothetical protein
MNTSKEKRAGRGGVGEDRKKRAGNRVCMKGDRKDE